MTERKAMTPDRKARILIAHDGKCWRCKEPFKHGDKIEFDHMQAIARGGSDDDSNIGPCHALCHALKTHGTAALRLGADIFEIAKTKRLAKGPKETKAKLPGGKQSKWIKKLNGKTELRGE